MSIRVLFLSPTKQNKNNDYLSADSREKMTVNIDILAAYFIKMVITKTNKS